jgi:hypothetical protein
MEAFDIWIPEDFIKIAEEIGCKLTHAQAEMLLRNSSTRIKLAMLQAAREIIRDVVENFCEEKSPREIGR